MSSLTFEQHIIKYEQNCEKSNIILIDKTHPFNYFLQGLTLYSFDTDVYIGVCNNKTNDAYFCVDNLDVIPIICNAWKLFSRKKTDEYCNIYTRHNGEYYKFYDNVTDNNFLYKYMLKIISDKISE